MKTEESSGESSLKERVIPSPMKELWWKVLYSVAAILQRDAIVEVLIKKLKQEGT